MAKAIDISKKFTTNDGIDIRSAIWEEDYLFKTAFSDEAAKSFMQKQDGLFLTDDARDPRISLEQLQTMLSIFYKRNHQESERPLIDFYSLRRILADAGFCGLGATSNDKVRSRSSFHYITRLMIEWDTVDDDAIEIGVNLGVYQAAKKEFKGEIASLRAKAVKYIIDIGTKHALKRKTKTVSVNDNSSRSLGEYLPLKQICGGGNATFVTEWLQDQGYIVRTSAKSIQPTETCPAWMYQQNGKKYRWSVAVFKGIDAGIRGRKITTK